jgi:hypothetical protein
MRENPVIQKNQATFDQQRDPEDQNIEKSHENLYGNQYQTRSKGVVTTKDGEVVKTGPPRREKESRAAPAEVVEHTSPEKETPVRQDKQGRTQQQELPYVDVPAIKPSVKASRAKQVESNKAGQVFKNKAPVEDEINIEDLVKKALDVEITIPLRSLAGASNVVRDEIRKQFTRLRKAVDKASLTTIIAGDGKQYVDVASIPVSTFMMAEDISPDVPEGHLVADDPVLQYLRDVKDADLDELIVARTSEPLRCIYATVNHVGQEECLLDNGSQIVSIRKDAAIELGLTWDPNIRINMESASNHIEKTLGLARNVPFGIGGLTILLQVHVLANPPYRLLLGRPFDTFANSVLRTQSDGFTLVTITDPNTKRQVSVPTYERGKGPEELQKQRVQAF